MKKSLEDLLERYSQREILDRRSYNDLVKNIDQLMPNIGLQLVQPKKIKLTSHDHIELDRILQEMKHEIKKEQLVNILKVLQIQMIKIFIKKIRTNNLILLSQIHHLT